VLGVKEREQEAHRYGLDLRLAKPVEQRIDGRGIDRFQDLALVAHTLGHLEAPLRGYDRLRWVCIEVVQIRPRLASDAQHITESARGHHGRASAFALQDRVGGHGRAMDYRRAVRELPQLCESAQHGLGRVARGRQHLACVVAPASCVEHDEVGKRAADVNADSQHSRCLRVRAR
jgi:hypothetical protein